MSTMSTTYSGPSDSGSVPERKLLEAILTDAIECWQECAVVATTWQVSGYSMGKRQRAYRDADFWIFGDYDNAPYWSFTEICGCLGLDPEFIRRRLLEWRTEAKHSARVELRQSARGGVRSVCSPSNGPCRPSAFFSPT